jgi:hypothetical protein
MIAFEPGNIFVSVNNLGLKLQRNVRSAYVAGVGGNGIADVEKSHKM